MRSHRQPATTVPERNLGTRPKISESDLVPTWLKCRFWIGDSLALLIAAQINICVIPKGGVCIRSHRHPATTLPERNLGAGPEISESDLVPIGMKCRFRIGDSRAVPIAMRTNIRVLPKGGENNLTGVTILAMLVHPYLRPGQEFSRRVEHNFRSP
ncbi:hypothetical protein Taro_056747 [Colocasia esculenta]|uniref:Uncharacterized protein n=1 Tax=Colocasia esculenta TaxID=4460 RepID=A0A843XXM1_COLES|nr:hypothetical protein [Colocasia esculenta]